MTSSPNTGDLVASITGIAAQLERMASGSAFVQDGFVRVLDPPYLIDKLRAAADRLEASATLERELEENANANARLAEQMERVVHELEEARAQRDEERRMRLHWAGKTGEEFSRAETATEELTTSQAEVERLKEALKQIGDWRKKPWTDMSDDAETQLADRTHALEMACAFARTALQLEERKT